MKAGAAEPSSAAAEAPGRLIALVCLAQFMVILDLSIVNVALPSIQHGLRFKTGDLQWILNAYAIAFTGFLMLGGRAADLLGRRRVFLLGTAMFALCSLACALAFSRSFMVGARALQGLAGAIMSPATLSIITGTLPEGPQRSRGVAIWGAMGGLGGASGSLFGGLLTQGLGWPAIFAINVPIGLVVVLFGSRLLPADAAGEPGRRFDFSGALLLTASLTGLTFAIVRSAALGWGALGVIAPGAAGLLLLGCFVWVEARWATAPLVPLAVLAIERLRAANLVLLLLYAAMFPVWYFLTLYLQEIRGFGAIQTGLAFLPMTLAIFAASTAAPRLMAALGPRRLISFGMLSTALGMLLLSLISARSGYFSAVFAGSMLASIGMGCVLVPTTIVATAGLPRHLAGLGSGLLNTARMIGGALGLASLSTLAADVGARAGAGGSAQVTSGYDAAFLAGSGLCLVAAILAYKRLDPGRASLSVSAAARLPSSNEEQFALLVREEG